MELQKIWLMLPVLIMALAPAGCAGSKSNDAIDAVVVNVIEKYGFVLLDKSGSDMLAAGFEHGDILSLKAGGSTFELPFVTNISDVDIYKDLLMDMGVQLLGTNMGDFAGRHGITEGMEISIRLAEKGGYLDKYKLRQVSRSHDRDDYASDEVFANFRELTQGSITPGMLYRSSSPVDNMFNRAAYASALAEQANIATVINMTDSREDLVAYFNAEDFSSYFYEGLFDDGRVIYLDLGCDLKSDDFRYGLRDAFMLMAENDGPYLIHCTEGKDRAGFMSALTLALMGADMDEIVADYMLSFVNYYHVVPGSAQYTAIAQGNIYQTLRIIAGLDAQAELEGVDMQAAAEDYIKALGLGPEYIAAVYERLAGGI